MSSGQKWAEEQDEILNEKFFQGRVDAFLWAIADRAVLERFLRTREELVQKFGELNRGEIPLKRRQHELLDEIQVLINKLERIK